MPGTVDIGVFLPVTNNGWVMSKTSPQFLPSFELNRDICQLAERVGFHYLFSMAKWRGFGGATDFWKYSLESTMLMAGLAAHVPRLRLIASIAPALIHPAIFAKMAATLDDVTGGRLGINIVSAGNPGEYTQMGLYPKNFEDFRYEYTEEWLTVIKRLWAEDSVTSHGKYFTLDDSVYRKRATTKKNVEAAQLHREWFEAKDMRLFYAGFPFVGGPERVADMIEELAVDGQVDGMLLIFPDFMQGVASFGELVMPILRQRGLVSDVSAGLGALA